MAGGLFVFGLSGYAFIALTGHTLTDNEANLAIAFYFLVNVVGPGIFYAVEQVTSRSTSRALASGHRPASALLRVRRAAAGLVVVVTALLLLLAPVLIGLTLHGDVILYAEVLATPAIVAVLHHVRGMLGGQQLFGGFAGTLAVEGGSRLAFTVLLVVLGTDEAWIFGLGYIAASVVAALSGMAMLRANRSGAPGPGIDSPAVAKSLLALALATLFAQLLPNIAPLVVTSRMAQDSAIALAFGQAAVAARIPLLLFLPVQTMMLPSLTAAVTRGEFGFFARRVRLILVVVTAAGALGAAVFVLLGPWALRTFFGTSVDLAPPIFMLLGLSTVVLIAAYVVQPALVALGRDRIVTAGWVVGSVATLGLVLLPGDPVNLAAIGQLIGSGLILLVVLPALWATIRTAHPPAAVGPPGH